MFCGKCGGVIPEGGGFCVKCGAPARPRLTPEGRLKRPGIVTLLAILDWIGGVIWLLIGAFGLMGTLAGAPADRNPFGVAAFAVLLGLAIFQIVCGFGLWKLRSYGRWMQLISSCLGLLAIPVGTVISIAILIYLNRPGIKLLFSEKPVESLAPDELALVAAATTSSGATTVIIAAVGVLAVVAMVGIIAAIAVPGLLRARIAGNEAATIGSLRAFSSAEASYALGNRALYDRPDCLVRPSDCIAGYSGAAFLQERLDQKNGYRFSFHPGAPPASLPAGGSLSSMTTFVVTAVPISDATGLRQFCVDHTAEVRAAPPSAETLTAGPSCPADWSTIR